MTMTRLVLAIVLAGCGSGVSCPATTPSAGAGCSDPGLACESGGGPHQRCSTTATCVNSQNPHDPEATDWSLSQQAMCTPANDQACPSDFASAPVAMACPTQGLQCDYAQGRCACVPCNPSGLNWRCRNWAAGIDPACPTDRPALGSKCSVDSSIVCRYDDACEVSFGLDQYCAGGIWVPRTGLAKPCAEPVCMVSDG